ncbi:hypothetical protein ACFFX0_13640 [Citricoccus parietis]|uniref:Uncharacterized protein n=1 Tax=Citricoccus parietis TaxID=592307 RepID=A0ABV5FZS7_9MICC
MVPTTKSTSTDSPAKPHRALCAPSSAIPWLEVPAERPYYSMLFDRSSIGSRKTTVSAKSSSRIAGICGCRDVVPGSSTPRSRARLRAGGRSGGPGCRSGGP